MAEASKRVGWDACTWIALIQKEKIFNLDYGFLAEEGSAIWWVDTADDEDCEEWLERQIG